MVRVLLDFHHHALAEAYALTLVDRLGMDVWFPAGMEWFDEGIWAFEKEWHGDRVARQYLEGIWDAPLDDGVTVQSDKRHPNRVIQGISLERARSQQWDYVISSLPNNDVGYHRLAQEVGARFGVQVGNDLQQSRWDLAEFILASSTLPGYGVDHIGERFTFMGTPTVMYHQEFDLDIFRQRDPALTKVDWRGRPRDGCEVASWVNCFGEGPSYPDFLAFAREYASEFDFMVYGALGTYGGDEFQGGDFSWVPEIADRMAGARVGWHTKHWSDGFGHTIHNWFAIGRPVIGYARYYKDKIAGALWDEGYTTFDIEHLSHEELAQLLRRLRDDDEYHARLCENAALRFRSTVDFEHEANLIAEVMA